MVKVEVGDKIVVVDKRARLFMLSTIARVILAENYPDIKLYFNIDKIFDETGKEVTREDFSEKLIKQTDEDYYMYMTKNGNHTGLIVSGKTKLENYKKDCEWNYDETWCFPNSKRFLNMLYKKYNPDLKAKEEKKKTSDKNNRKILRDIKQNELFILKRIEHNGYFWYRSGCNPTDWSCMKTVEYEYDETRHHYYITTVSGPTCMNKFGTNLMFENPVRKLD